MLLVPYFSRYITRLLEDLVFFAIKKENTGEKMNPLTVEGKADRDRQKLIREQYVLKAVWCSFLI